MNKLSKLISMVLAFSLLLTGCGSGAVKSVAVTKLSAGEMALAKLSQSGGSTLQAGAAEFSVNLLKNVMSESDGNTVISPLSAYLALAMAVRGANGETLAQMEKMLGASSQEIAAFANDAINRLAGTNGSASVTLANSAWIDNRFNISQEYVKDLQSWFAAESYNCTLSSDAAREAINGWVSENTQGLIPALLDENLTDTAMLALINTLYMKALWQTPFTAETTTDRAFTTDAGKVIQTPTMLASGLYPYCELPNGGKAVLLRYADCDLAFVAVLPPEGMSGAAYAATLTADNWHSCLAAQDANMNLYLPKFTAEFSVTLNNALQAMGMTDAFGAADFSGITDGASDLYISTVLQKAKIIVDENGTEAAAATAIITKNGALFREDLITLDFNRSFAYAVVDTATGTPLFMGIEANPAE